MARFGRCAEAWLPMPDYAGLYEVSSLGRVRSLHRRFAEPRLCKLGTDQTGYPTVMLSKDGARKPFTVHRLVALAFLGDKRNALHREVAHLDGSQTNGRADNLKWVSRTENEAHKRVHGTRAPERYSKLTKEQVSQLFEANFPLVGTECPKGHPGDWLIVFGYSALRRSQGQGTGPKKDRGKSKGKSVPHAEACEAMGIDWMGRMELSQAIPPAYTQFIGTQLFAHLQSERLAA